VRDIPANPLHPILGGFFCTEVILSDNPDIPTDKNGYEEKTLSIFKVNTPNTML
jgi:hypothetical protein